MVATLLVGSALSLQPSDLGFAGRAGTTAFAAMTGIPPQAGAVVKTDGTRVEGQVSREEEGWVVTGKDGVQTTIATNEVKSVEVGGKPDPKAESGLASLRRSTEALGDPKRAVERYKQFVATYRDSAAAAEGQLDLALWQERLDKGLARIMGKWVTPAEAAVLRAGATDQAKAAIEALRQSKMNDAGDLLAAALAADPKNPTALYVKGVLSYRQDKLQDARRAFEASLESATSYGPSLNNVAVTAFRMNQYPLALNFYDQALVAMPLERGLLNNVAEALEALPDNVRNTAIAKRVKRKFDEQDTLLAQRLAQQGLFRWGATWVDRAQLDDVRAAEQKTKATLDRLAGQYQALADKIIHLEGQIAANQRDMSIMESQTLRSDGKGGVYQFPLPAAYYTLKSMTDGYIADREAALQQQASIRSQARAAQKETPAPKYTGIQQIFAAEAAPVPAAPPGSAPPSPPSGPSPTSSPGQADPPTSTRP